MNMPPVDGAVSAPRPCPAGLRWFSRELRRSAVFGGPASAILAGVASLGPLRDDPLAPVARQFAVFGLAVAVCAALLVQGLWRERRWTRPGLLAYATACAAFPVVVSQQMPVRPPLAAFAGLPVGILLIWWYLYRKRTVATYYESLRRAR